MARLLSSSTTITQNKMTTSKSIFPCDFEVFLCEKFLNWKWFVSFLAFNAICGLKFKHNAEVTRMSREVRADL